MELIATPEFLASIEGLLSDLELWALEDFVTLHPEAGDRIPGGRGLRKLRWAVKGKARGKRGGMRVIYYFRVPDRIVFLLAYEKCRKEDLTPDQIATLVVKIRGGASHG